MSINVLYLIIRLTSISCCHAMGRFHRFIGNICCLWWCSIWSCNMLKCSFHWLMYLWRWSRHVPSGPPQAQMNCHRLVDLGYIGLVVEMIQLSPFGVFCLCPREYAKYNKYSKCASFYIISGFMIILTIGIKCLPRGYDW